MADPSHCTGRMHEGNERVVTGNTGQLFVAYNSGDSTRHGQVEGGARRDVSPKSKPEEDSSDQDTLDSESASASEEETVISEESQEDKIVLRLKTYPKSNSPGPSENDQNSTTAVPPALLGEIRKMIQEECE